MRTAGLPLGCPHTLPSGRPPTDGTGPPGSLAASRVAGRVSNSASVCGESATKRIRPYTKHPRWLISHKRILIFTVTHETLLCNRVLLGDYFWTGMWATYRNSMYWRFLAEKNIDIAVEEIVIRVLVTADNSIDT